MNTGAERFKRHGPAVHVNDDSITLPRHLQLCVPVVSDFLQESFDSLEVLFAVLLMMLRVLQLSNTVNYICSTKITAFHFFLSWPAQSRNRHAVLLVKHLR